MNDSITREDTAFESFRRKHLSKLLKKQEKMDHTSKLSRRQQSYFDYQHRQRNIQKQLTPTAEFVFE
jgi:DNA-binding TFAR19-related protein (PDSD5 family)